jgi:Tol biopolymer transport system component
MKWLGWLVAALAAVSAIATYWFVLPQKTSSIGPVRFQIPAPNGQIIPVASSISVSPDGKKYAFIAGELPNQTLWVRSADWPESRQIPGANPINTEPDGLFWSPDSRYIAFFGGTYKLRKVSVDGGPVQDICDLPSFGGGTWNRDGTILISRQTTGLMKVAQAGGLPAPVEGADPNGEPFLVSPRFLPDGRHYIYVAVRNEPAVVLRTIEGGTRKVLANGISRNGGLAWVHGSGRLSYVLFVKDDILMAQPVGSDFNPAGDLFPVAEHVVSFTASENGVIAWRSSDVSFKGQRPQWIDRSGKVLSEPGPPGTYADIAVSPDGKRAAFGYLSPKADSVLNVWTMDVERGTASRLSFEPGEQRFVAWSPDSSSLAFASGAGRAHDRILLRAADGSGAAQTLFTGGNDIIVTDWSADRKYIFYSDIGTATGRDLFLLPMSPDAKSKPIPYLQSKTNELEGVLSPDDKWVAYVSDEQGHYEVFVQSLPAGQGKFQISTAGGTQPRWRRDGREIFYLALDGTLMSVQVKTAPRFESSAPVPLFKTKLGLVGTYGYDASPDGKRFLVKTDREPFTSAEQPFTVMLNWQPEAAKK